MNLILSKKDLRELLAQSAEIGAKMALIATGQLKPYLSKTEAYKLHGRCTVDRWIAERLVTPRKDGGHSAKWRLDRIELETISKASNRTTYLTIDEIL